MTNLIPEKPLDISSDFNKLIDSYNNKDTTKESKTESLEKINATVHKLLEEKKSPAVADALKSILKAVKVQTNDIQIWKEIMGEIEKVSPSISKAKIEDIPDELFYHLIIEELAKEDIGSLAKTNKRFNALLSKPESLAHFLDKFSSQIPFEKRFPLAIRCGSSLYKLDLSKCQVNDEQLKELKEKCPKLESLNLSNTGIKSLDHLPENLTYLNLSNNKSIDETGFNKLAYLSKLENLELKYSRIKSLEKLPKTLKKINLFACMSLPSQEFDQLRFFSNLESLFLGGTKISSLDPILSKNLKEIDLQGCHALTTEEVKKLADLPQLKVIHLQKRFEKEEKLISLLKAGGKEIIFAKV